MNCGCQGLSPHLTDEENEVQRGASGAGSINSIGICVLLLWAFSAVVGGTWVKSLPA